LGAGPGTFYFYWLVRSEKTKPLILWSLGFGVTFFSKLLTHYYLNDIIYS
jgi:hypothetical protein